MATLIERLGPELAASGIPRGYRVLGRVLNTDKWILMPLDDLDPDIEVNHAFAVASPEPTTPQIAPSEPA